MAAVSRDDILNNLRSDILRLQGFRSCKSPTIDIGLGPILNAFPNRTFPLGAVHEFLSAQPEHTACTFGFIAALLSSIMNTNGVSIWISTSRMLYPPALKSFGINPDRCIFIHLHKEKDVLWTMNEALKCNAISAVVAQVRELDFKTSRQLQLAVEQSEVTGFIIRSNLKNISATTCVSRWKISSLISESDEDLPGIGFPKWKIELLRIRNGKPGAWDMQWVNGKFVPAYNFSSATHEQEKKVG
jgi:protein ImuA